MTTFNDGDDEPTIVYARPVIIPRGLRSNSGSSTLQAESWRGAGVFRSPPPRLPGLPPFGPRELPAEPGNATDPRPFEPFEMDLVHSPIANAPEEEPTSPIVPELRSTLPMELDLGTPEMSALAGHRWSGLAQSIQAFCRRSRVFATLLMATVSAITVVSTVRFLARPRTGTVTVYATDPGNSVLDRFNLAVDGQQRCTASPCTFELEPGMHGLRAEAFNHVANEHGIAVNPGSNLTLRINLNGDPQPPQPKVSEIQPAPPASIVTETRGAEPLRAERATNGANSDGEPSSTTSVIRGIDPLLLKPELPDKLPGGQAYKTAPSRAPAQRRRAPMTKPSSPALGSPCSVNINSIPPASIVLDGQPFGVTPRLGVPVTPGDHALTFLRQDGGRVLQTVSCKSGESKVVAVHLTEAP